jgi:hypothetical protein
MAKQLLRHTFAGHDGKLKVSILTPRSAAALRVGQTIWFGGKFLMESILRQKRPRVSWLSVQRGKS